MSVVTKALSDKLPTKETPLMKRQVNILSAILGSVGIRRGGGSYATIQLRKRRKGYQLQGQSLLVFLPFCKLNEIHALVGLA